MNVAIWVVSGIIAIVDVVIAEWLVVLAEQIVDTKVIVDVCVDQVVDVVDLLLRVASRVYQVW